MKKIFVTSIVLLSLCSLLFSTPATWYKYNDAQGRFTAGFPVAPEEQLNKSTDVSSNLVETLKLSTADNVQSYELSVTVYKKQVLADNEPKTIKETADKIMEQFLGSTSVVAAYSVSTFKDFNSVDYTITDKSASGIFYKNRIIFNEKTIYHLIVTYSSSRPDRSALYWFTNGIDIKTSANPRSDI